MDKIATFCNQQVGVLYDINSNTFIPLKLETYKELLGKNASLDEMFQNEKCIEVEEIKSFKKTKRIDQLKIIVQNGCNLRCKYCYADGGTYKFQPSHFTPKTVVEFLTSIFYSGIKSINRVMFFGGEPTVYPDVIEATCHYFEEKFNEGVIKEIPTYSMVSNGMIYTEKLAKIIKNYNIVLTLSIDGPKAINDKLRVTECNTGSYDQFKKNYNHMVKDGIIPALIEVTYTKEHASMGYSKIDIVDYINKEFPYSKIYVADCQGEYGLNYNNEEKFEDFCENFDSTLEKIMMCNPAVDRDYLKIIMRFCKKERVKNLRCNIVAESLTLYPNGDIYPCQLMTNDKYYLGNMKNGILNIDGNNEVLNTLLKTSRTSSEQCEHCWLRNICDKCPRDDMSTYERYINCDFCRRTHEHALLKIAELYLDKEKWSLFRKCISTYLLN